jgi:hypothetical protein
VSAVLVVAVLLSLQTYDKVKGPLQEAQDTLTRLAHNPSDLNSASGRIGVERQLAKVSQEIGLAQSQIDQSDGLKILGIIPGLHTQRRGLEQLVSDLHSTTTAAANLLAAVNKLAAASHGTTVSLADLKSLGQVFKSTQEQLASENRSTSGLWGPLGHDRQKFDREDSRATKLLGQGVDLTNYALPFLGAQGPQTYLVMGENNAEMRDQGSPLSYALLHTTGGSFSVADGGNIHQLQLTAPASVSVPAGTSAVFGGLNVTQTWQNTNATANFAFSGGDMQAMFAQATGIHVNGVIGLDTVALEGLLGLSGPVSVAGIPEPVTAQNAGYVLLDQLYAGLPANSPQGPRREELTAVASGAVHQLQFGKVDLVALARTLATAVGGRHLQLWDEAPQYERTVRELGASGAIDTDDPSRTFHVAVENATASKLDYFVAVSISDQVYVLKDGSAVVRTAVTVHNSAPAGQPASYQLGPDGANATVEGQYVGRVFLWGPRGSSQPSSTSESGLSLNAEQDLSLLPGQTKTAYFETTILHAVSHGILSLVFVPQPRLQPVPLDVQLHVPGSHTPRTLTTRVLLERTAALSWAFG